MDTRFIKLLDGLTAKADIDTGGLVYLIEHGGEEEQALLFERADTVRRERVGDEVHLRGIIEFSNHCRRDCAYCGLRRSNTGLERYRMEPDEILAVARKAAEAGLGTVVLQSGEDVHFTTRLLSDIIREIKRSTGCAVTLSLGELSFEDYKELKCAGADRFLLKHETADPELYRALHPGMSLKSRITCLKWLKQLGYQVGAGNIVGLPGQTARHLARDLKLLKALDVEMAGIGPFVASPETPLSGLPNGSARLTLRLVALARLMMPDVMLPATTALGVIEPGGRRKALQCGANVVMPNITPKVYHRNYRIYPKPAGPDDLQADISEAREMIAAIGRPVATGPGHSPKLGQRTQASYTKKD